MSCLKLQKISTSTVELCIKKIINQRKICDKNFHRHLHQLSPRCLYSSQHSSIQQKKNHDSRIIPSEIHKKFSRTQILIYEKNIKTLLSCKNYPVHQSKRFYGDSVVAAAATTIGSNAPLGQYGAFLTFLSSSAPVTFCQNSLLTLHSSTGLPWWATIVLVTCCARTCVTLPLALYQQYISAKISNIKLEMNDIVEELKMETNRAVDIFGWTEIYARSMYDRSVKQQWDKLIIRDNCHPMKGMILVLIQIPMWVILSASFRNLCFMLPRPTLAGYEIFMQLSVEGFGWISNLTAVDPYYILPVSLGLINLAIIELHTLIRARELTRGQKIMRNISRGISLIMVPAACIVPTCMSLYWVTSSTCGLVHSLMVVSPRVRRFVRIPESDLDFKQPYRHLYDNFKQKYPWIYNKKLI